MAIIYVDGIGRGYQILIACLTIVLVYAMPLGNWLMPQLRSQANMVAYKYAIEGKANYSNLRKQYYSLPKKEQSTITQRIVDIPPATIKLIERYNLQANSNNNMAISSILIYTLIQHYGLPLIYLLILILAIGLLVWYGRNSLATIRQATAAKQIINNLTNTLDDLTAKIQDKKNALTRLKSDVATTQQDLTAVEQSKANTQKALQDLQQQYQQAQTKTQALLAQLQPKKNN